MDATKTYSNDDLSTKRDSIENRMNTRTTGINWKAIALFYLIAVLTRIIALKCLEIGDSPFSFWLRVWAEGIGPCLGALAAVLVFKRSFYCTLTGRSLMKSIATVALPFIVCFLFDRSLSFTLLGFISYSLLEEVGWRGYLQGELKDMNHTLRIFIITTMWFFWHITIGFNIESLAFYGVLFLGSWGIGNIARDTQSLMACACFHTLFNFSNYLQFTPVVIALGIAVFATWIVIWYYGKKQPHELKRLNNKQP